MSNEDMIEKNETAVNANGGTELFMRGLYDGAGDARWAWSDARKRGELLDGDMRYLVAREGEGRLPLTRGFLPHPRAKLLLMLAFRDGDILA